MMKARVLLEKGESSVYMLLYVTSIYRPLFNLILGAKHVM